MATHRRSIRDGSDRGGYPPDTTTRSFKNGVWRNSNGAQVALGSSAESPATLGKSTGDMAPTIAKYVGQRKRAGAKGY